MAPRFPPPPPDVCRSTRWSSSTPAVATSAPSRPSWCGWRYPGARLTDLGTVVQGERGQRLLALRYIIANGAIWQTRFVWKPALQALSGGNTAAAAAVEALLADIALLKAELSVDPRAHHAWARDFVSPEAGRRLGEYLAEAETLRFLVLMHVDEELRKHLFGRCARGRRSCCTPRPRPWTCSTWPPRTCTPSPRPP